MGDRSIDREMGYCLGDTYHPACVATFTAGHSNDIFPPAELQDFVEVEGPFEVDVARVFELHGDRWIRQGEQLELG